MAGLVLDTHAWIWLVLDDPELRPEARDGIAAAAAQDELYLSVISVWEVAMLEARRRIAITAPIRDWVESALALPGLRVAGLTPEVGRSYHRRHGAASPRHAAFPGPPHTRLRRARASVHHASMIAAGGGA